MVCPSLGGQEKDLSGHSEVIKIQKATEVLLGDEALYREMVINLFIKNRMDPMVLCFRERKINT